MTETTRRATLAGLAAAAGSAPFTRLAFSQDAAPIRIGYGMSLSGPLAVNGKSALVAQKIWEEEINRKGGLLGRPVRLVYYDDQSNASTVPGIYTKLIDVDHVDLVIGGYATNMIAPAMPVVMAKNRTFISLMGFAVNEDFNYPNYFAMIPAGPDPKPAFTMGFFDIAMAQDPKPQTVAIAAADAEFSRSSSDGARENAKKAQLKIVYDRTYPPATTDFGPIVRAIAATNPDLLVICSYPLDSVGMLRAIAELGFKPKMVGGSMVGLQATAIKMQLGPLLNGVVNYDYWLPTPTMQFPGIAELIKTYQSRAEGEGVDPLGYYMAPFAYAQLQVLGQAVEGTKSLDDKKLSDYMHVNIFPTVLGDLQFGPKGEWASSRILQVQFQALEGNGLDQFRGTEHQIVVTPQEYASGKLIYPFANARK